MWVWSLGWEDPLEELMATHSSILAWRIPWTEEPGGLQSKVSRVGHDWSDFVHVHTHTHTHARTNICFQIFKTIFQSLKSDFLVEIQILCLPFTLRKLRTFKWLAQSHTAAVSQVFLRNTCRFEGESVSTPPPPHWVDFLHQSLCIDFSWNSTWVWMRFSCFLTPFN